MDERRRRRGSLIARATRLTGRRSLHDILPPPPPGTRRMPLIIGLPDDTLGSTLRNAEKVGGHAHLIVLEELLRDRVGIHVLRIEISYKPVTEADDPERPIPQDWELGMFIQNTEPTKEFTYDSWGSETGISFLATIVLPVSADA
jgi:hypothetical protein